MNSDLVGRAAEQLYQEESRRIHSTLIRLLGDYDLAEDAMHEAFGLALKVWARDGLPQNRRAWIVSVARHKGIDWMRRQVKMYAPLHEGLVEESVEADFDCVEDDILRLIFACCHPSLALESQVALTLREVCGLSTEEIAKAFLLPVPTLAQRIVRAKKRIRDEKIPFEIPVADELGERLPGVLTVTYLVFNEGYYASVGDSVTRSTFSTEAIRLGRILAELLPEPEVLGLLALMVLQESRRKARATEKGDIVLLGDQDRSLWDKALIEEGEALLERTLGMSDPGSYTLQAAISAVHARSTGERDTDWARIVGYYDALYVLAPSPVVDLNRAVAIAMRDGAESGLRLVEEILARGELAGYGLAHSARADLCRRLGLFDEALISYKEALRLATMEPERRFLSKQISLIEKK